MINLSLFGEPIHESSVNATSDKLRDDVCPLLLADDDYLYADADETDSDMEQKVDWSTDEIDYFCYQYLIACIGWLCRPGNGKAKYLVLLWIADDSLQDGLSFNLCCASCGLDPDVIRDHIRRSLKAKGIRFTTNINLLNRIRLGTDSMQFGKVNLDELVKKQKDWKDYSRNISIF